MTRKLVGIVAPPVMLMLCLLSGPIAADNTGAVAPSLPANPVFDQAAALLPTIAFRADASGNDLFDALQSAHVFAHLSKEAPGSPIQLRIYHTVHPTNVDAKNFFSGLLAVGTLGLSPVIMSGDYTMHYDLYVNGQRISRYEYTAKLSRNEHLNGKSADATHGLGPDGVVWAKSTVNLFLNDLARDNSVRALNDEYKMYFGALAPAVGISVQ
ncbi:MAG TPA: hypothetical protein VGL34_28120 [Steroidobacteraceae bacterium]|jgi:hypothetical protein